MLIQKFNSNFYTGNYVLSYNFQ
uniref:Uncharacterized protein n=1 Tax=Arundo donax TaxID=35708 RepID=A0A0A9BE47_ARUDO